MKKIFWIIIIFSLLIISGCSKTQNNSENILISSWQNTSSGEFWDIISYQWDLIVAWIWPDISFEPTVWDDTLVLKKTYEDHSDHLFFSRMFWDNYLDISEDCIPWNIIKFDGKVKPLDAAAWNHYYEVVETDTLEKIGIPNEEEVIQLINRYNYCEKDEECNSIYWKCPLPCHITVNNKFTKTVESIINNFWDNQKSQCTYDCIEIKKTKCENYKCITQ